MSGSITGSVATNPPRSWPPTGELPASSNERVSVEPASAPEMSSSTVVSCTCDCGKEHPAPGWTFAVAVPVAFPLGRTTAYPFVTQSLRHAPPSCSRCSVSDVIANRQATGPAPELLAGVAVGRAPGSSTPGGKGLDP